MHFELFLTFMVSYITMCVDVVVLTPLVRNCHDASPEYDRKDLKFVGRVQSIDCRNLLLSENDLTARSAKMFRLHAVTRLGMSRLSCGDQLNATPPRQVFTPTHSQ